MAAGLSTTNLANSWLNLLRGVAFTAPTSLYVKLHTGDPGASGTANPSGNTTRVALTFSAASGGTVALTGTPPSWTMTTSETLTHISVWDASTSGNFLWSVALSSSKTVTNSDTFTLTACGISLSPVAA